MGVQSPWAPLITVSTLNYAQADASQQELALSTNELWVIPPQITSFQSLDQYCQHTAVYPTRNTLLTITLFREIITMHTPVWKLFIVYSSSPKLEQLKVWGFLFLFLKESMSVPFTTNACWEKLLFSKIEFQLPWIYKPKGKCCGQDPRP